MEKVGLYLKFFNVKPENIHCVLILHEVLKDSELKKGYIKLDDNTCAWHLWVEHENKILDINKYLYKLWNKDAKDLNWEYQDESFGKKIINENYENELDFYKSHKSLYWRSVPKQINRARQKITCKFST